MSDKRVPPPKPATAPGPVTFWVIKGRQRREVTIPAFHRDRFLPELGWLVADCEGVTITIPADDAQRAGWLARAARPREATA